MLLALLFAVFAFHLKLKKVPDEKTISHFASFMSRSFEVMNKIAPECQFTLLTGEKINLSDIVGKKCIVINFFATWCEPCKREIPSLNKFYEKLSKMNVFMVGVSSEKMAVIEKFLEENKINFHVAVDDGEIEKKFAIEVYPTTVVIDGDGKIVAYITGAIYNPEATLEPKVKSAVAMIQSGKGISKEQFLKQSKIQSPYGLKYQETKRGLTEQEKRIAKQIYCPRGCGKNLIECDCSMCREAIEEMKEEMKKCTSEKEIVKKINTRYCSVKDD